MKYTAKELHAIESTMHKLTQVSHTVWNRDTTDGSNARHIGHIIAELRMCAELMESPDRATRIAGADRLVSIIAD
jgi:ubiquinone biosynthesis protein COQ9